MPHYSEKSPSLWGVIKDMSVEDASDFVTAVNEARDSGASHRAAVRAGLEAIRKVGPTASDVHVDAPLADDDEDELCPDCGQGWDECTCDRFEGEAMKILKVDEDQRMVYGWASVISEGGKVHVDTQDDAIEAHELEKAVTDFMIDVRKALLMHERNSDGSLPDERGIVVHSFPMTSELMKALGISCDKEGWIVGVKVGDEEVWKQVKSGKLPAFSIGGSGTRHKKED